MDNYRYSEGGEGFLLDRETISALIEEILGKRMAWREKI